PQAPVQWQATRISGSDSLAVRASKKLRSDELLITALGSTILRKQLDDVPLWRGDHVPIRQLVDDFARYLYLPRLTDSEVLTQAIRDGVGFLTWSSDTFAYAESYDEAAKRYRGLRAGQTVIIMSDSTSLLVKPEVARKQMEAEVKPESPAPGPVPPGPAGKPPGPTPPAPEAKLKRFHGTVALDPTRAGRDASRIADEVLAHLVGQPGAEVTVTLEIEATLQDGASDQVVRTVTENSRTLKFTSHGFEVD
ncbi:MAG: AAA+ family ATPase, partial [Limisphaerales bacterium]